MTAASARRSALADHVLATSAELLDDASRDHRDHEKRKSRQEPREAGQDEGEHLASFGGRNGLQEHQHHDRQNNRDESNRRVEDPNHVRGCRLSRPGAPFYIVVIANSNHEPELVEPAEDSQIGSVEGSVERVDVFLAS